MTGNQTELELEKTFLLQKAAYYAEPHKSYQQRCSDLTRLKLNLLKYSQQLEQALSADFGYRSEDVSRIGDIFSSISNLNYTLKHLKSWMKPKKRKVGWFFQPASAEERFQPLGVVGIIAPWNYPVFLVLSPLVAALAAGNRVMIKCSEYTPHTNRCLKIMLSELFANDHVALIEGAADVAAEFTALQFDHLFFTGSTQVGRLVMKAAAENLTPVTLELGGKSPVIIDDKIELKTAVERFIYGKTVNCGQTCVAPDYVFCPTERIDELIEQTRTAYQNMYPEETASRDSTRVINAAQVQRLNNWLQDAKQKGAQIHYLQEGETDAGNASLILVSQCSFDMQILQQEIFGPILPIVGYDDPYQVVDIINQKGRPLALYIMSFDKAFQQLFLQKTHSGGVCINDSTFHVAMDDLPFGGIGASGMGRYHGEEGFRTFSHSKTLLKRGKIFPTTMLFPPYKTSFQKLFYRLLIK